MKSNPILKVLSSIRTNRVRALLMGGQACVFYGAAEFSRDTDLEFGEICRAGKNGEIGIATKLCCAVEHACLAAH